MKKMNYDIFLINETLYIHTPHFTIYDFGWGRNDYKNIEQKKHELRKCADIKNTKYLFQMKKE